jgi:head-tail adaptor
MIGRKRERVRVTRRTREKDANGDYVVGTTVVAERWASVRPTTGMELELAGTLGGTLKYEIALDLYGLTVSSADALVWITRDNATLNIREVRLSTVRDVDTVLICEIGVVNGAVP